MNLDCSNDGGTAGNGHRPPEILTLPRIGVFREADGRTFAVHANANPARADQGGAVSITKGQLQANDDGVFFVRELKMPEIGRDLLAMPKLAPEGIFRSSPGHLL